MAARPRQDGDGEGGGADGIMPVPAMRELLHMSKQKPVSCAIALTKDKQAVLLLHRTMGPKKVRAELKTQAKAAGVDLDLTTVRFGRATVDGGSDSQGVNVAVNKAVPNVSGFEMKLKARVKPAGFKHCSLSVDDKLNSEPDDDAPGDAAAGARAPGSPADAAPLQPPAAPAPSSAPSPPPQASPAAPSGMALDVAQESTAAPQGEASPAAATTPGWQDAVKSRLTGLAQRIGTETQPGTPRRRELLALANQANAAMKGGGEAGATAGLAALRTALAEPANAGGNAQASQAPAAAAPATPQPGAGPRQPTPDQPGFAGAALRAGFDRAASTPRDRSGDQVLAQNAVPGTPGTATDAPPSAPLPGGPEVCPPSDYERGLREAAEAHRARTVAFWQQQYDQARQNPWNSRVSPREAQQNLESARSAPLSHFVDSGLGDRGRMNALDAGRQNMREMAEFQNPRVDAELCRHQQAIDGNDRVNGALGILAEGVDTVGPAAVGAFGGRVVPRPPMPAPGRAPSWQRPQPPAPPALTGEVMPPSPPQQAFSLGQAQVRPAPTEPAWPQTVTLGPARAGGSGQPAGTPAAPEPALAARELAARAAAERTVAEQQALARQAAAQRQTAAEAAEALRRREHEELRRAYRADMERPATTDPRLTAMMREIYREGAQVGSGSTAAAVRAERLPGVQVGGRDHRLKAQERIVNLQRWLANNPTASPRDRAAAENVIQDMIDALNGR